MVSLEGTARAELEIMSIDSKAPTRNILNIFMLVVGIEIVLVFLLRVTV